MTFILIKILMWELSMLYCHSFYNYIVFLVESNMYGFFIISFYMYCRWRSNYQEVRYMFPLTSSTPPHLCACSKPEPAFPMSLSSFQWVNMIGDCSICWYCSNWWSSLFNLSFHSYIRGPLHTLIAKSDKLLPL